MFYIFGQKGFTLAELLISLAILGVIATFTIPKILSSQQNGSLNASTEIDSYFTQSSLDWAAWQCYRRANGSMIAFDAGQTFGANDELAVTFFC